MKKPKIMISVISIVIVLLIILGVTYAYFLTRVVGNTENTSISTTSAKYELIYGDGTSKILTSSEPLVPTVGTDASDAIGIKDFTVTNKGQAFNYAVLIEDVIVTKLSDGSTTVFDSNDFRYTLTCTKKDGSSCYGVNDLTLFPINGGKLVENNIAANDVHTYTLTMWYIDNGKNQSSDMGKSLQARVNISDIATDNPFRTGNFAVDKVNLAYNIIENGRIGKNETFLINDPLTSMSEAKERDEKIISLEPDDLGTSYYFSGDVLDNYVTFADMCWRIVRIEGDGSIKLILEDQDQVCSKDINGNWAIPTTTNGTIYTGNFGYTKYERGTLTSSTGQTNDFRTYIMDYLHGTTDSDNSMATAFKNFQKTFSEIELSKLKSGNWCILDNKGYDSDNNILNATQMMDYKILDSYFNYTKSYTDLLTLKCDGTIMNDWEDNEATPTPMYVGTITANEVIYAGAYTGGNAGVVKQNYLINNEFRKGSSGVNKSSYFWTLTPYNFYAYSDTINVVVDYGDLSRYDIDFIGDVASSSLFRPAVSLASGTVITGGEGTIGNPYVIG